MDIIFQSGGHSLNAIIDLCEFKSNKYILYVPGINFKFHEIDWLKNLFVGNGYNFIRFNFKYHQDGNDIDDFNLESDLEDIQSLLNYLDFNGFDIKNIGVISKSFGGIKGFLLNDGRIKVHGFVAPVTYFGEKPNIHNIKTLKYGEINNIKDVILDNKILEHWKHPTIIIHGDKDIVVNISNSENIYNKIGCDKKFIDIKGLGHSYNNEFNNIIGNDIIKFFKQYL